MISISHWGEFDIDNSPSVELWQEIERVYGYWLGTYWDEKFKKRFPNGVTPVETPFLKMFK